MKIKKFCNFKVKCNEAGKPYLTRLIRVYFKIQKNNRIEENRKTRELSKIYDLISTRNVEDVKKAARIELNKKYVDNVYSLFCNYILLTGEV